MHLQQPGASPALDSLFAPPATPPRPATIPAAVPPAVIPALPSVFGETKPADSVWPRALADAFAQQNPPTPQASQPPPVAHRPAASAADIHKLRAEISCLELLVKKLQTELQIERQYNQALELHVRNLTKID